MNNGAFIRVRPECMYFSAGCKLEAGTRVKVETLENKTIKVISKAEGPKTLKLIKVGKNGCRLSCGSKQTGLPDGRYDLFKQAGKTRIFHPSTSKAA